MKIRFSRQAETDIIRSYLYGLTNFGPLQADQYEASLRATISLIGDHPQMAAERVDIDPPVRVHHHGKHLIIYRIEADHILIIRVLRDEVDLTERLEEG